MENTLPEIYNIFTQAIETHPYMAQPDNKAILNSAPFYEAVEKGFIDSLLSSADPSAIIESIRLKIRDQNPAKYEMAFAGAVYGACAARLIEKKEPTLALKLAEKAIDYNWLDLFPQDIIIEANHQIDPRVPGLEDTKAWLKTRFCTFPFSFFETAFNRNIYTCCSTFLPTPICTLDDVDKNGLDAVHNSPALKAIRESIIDGSFSFCSKMHCTSINNRWLIPREEGLEKIKTMSEWPEDVTLSHDRSCNLSCPSCREERIVIPKSEQEELDTLTKKLFLPIMQHAKTVHVTGSGDPFVSIHFRNMLREYCRRTTDKVRRLSLLTNAMLCDEKAWKDIGLYGHVKVVFVSIDAATEETYDIVRRGGDFKRTIENMRFLARLRRDGEYDHLLQRFVVQTRNFREMPAFVQMGLELGVDAVEFNIMRNWGTFSAEEFAENNIASPDHPDHGEFLKMLEDPIFDNPIVHLSGLKVFRPEQVRAVEVPAAAMLDQEPVRLSATDLFQHLYAFFLRTLMDAPEIVSWELQSITNSELFCKAARSKITPLLAIKDSSILIDIINRAIDERGPDPYATIFKGAVCTILASRFREMGEIGLARNLATEALLYNKLDLFSQNIAAQPKVHLRDDTSLH